MTISSYLILVCKTIDYVRRVSLPLIVRVCLQLLHVLHSLFPIHDVDGVGGHAILLTLLKIQGAHAVGDLVAK